MASFTVPILCSGMLRGITQAPPCSVPTHKVKYGVHDHSTAFHLYAKEQPLLTVDSCASCVQTEVVLPNSYILYFILSSSNGYSSSSIAVCLYAHCVRVNELHSALSCWDLLVGIQGCNRLASVVGSGRACTGTEGAASSKFRRVNINDRLKILDTIKKEMTELITLACIVSNYLRFTCFELIPFCPSGVQQPDLFLQKK